MDRNRSLVLSLLTEAEASEETTHLLDVYEEREILLCSELLIEAGLLYGECSHDESGQVIEARIERLTMKGQKALADLRSDSGWRWLTNKLGLVAKPAIGALLSELAKRMAGM